MHFKIIKGFGRFCKLDQSRDTTSWCWGWEPASEAELRITPQGSGDKSTLPRLRQRVNKSYYLICRVCYLYRIWRLKIKNKSFKLYKLAPNKAFIDFIVQKSSIHIWEQDSPIMGHFINYRFRWTFCLIVVDLRF